MLNGGYFRYDTCRKYILFIEDHIRFSSPAVISKYFSHIEQSGFMQKLILQNIYYHLKNALFVTQNEPRSVLAFRRVGCGHFLGISKLEIQIYVCTP